MSNIESAGRDGSTGESEEVVGFDDELPTDEEDEDDEFEDEYDLDQDPMRDI